MLIAGLTGGIACGKSTATRWFLRRGVPVVDADALVHRIQARGGPALPRIRALFPGCVSSEGVLDRKKLGEIIFADAEKRRALNRLMRPFIADALLKEFWTHFRAGTPLVVLDAPLLFETGLHRVCALTVVVAAPAAIQRARVVARDGVSRENADKKIASQMPLDAKRRKAHLVVENVSTVAALEADLEARVLPRLEKRVWLHRVVALRPVVALVAAAALRVFCAGYNVFLWLFLLALYVTVPSWGRRAGDASARWLKGRKG